MKHITSLLFFLVCTSFIGLFAQGLINNSTFIVISSNSYLVIDGPDGNYRSIGSSSTFVANGLNGEVHVNGNWTNNATSSGFTNDGIIVRFKGGNQSIAGTTTTFFPTVYLEGSGTKTLNINTSVGGVINLTGSLNIGNRVLDLNGYSLTMRNPSVNGITSSTGYVVSETNLAVNPSRIIWQMGASNGSYVYPFGVAGTRIPLIFQKLSGNASVSISTRATGPTNQPWAGISSVGPVTSMSSIALEAADASIPAVIDRWWDIAPSAVTSANITFSYRLSENTTSFIPEDFGAQHWNGTLWEAPIGAGSSNGTVGQVVANGLIKFSPYVLAPLVYPLPITLIDFSVDCESAKRILTFKTIRNAGVSDYILKHSFDGVNWSEVQSVEPIGNVGSQANYTLIDENIRANYYQLAERTSDGKVHELGTYPVDCSMEKSSWNIIPNPNEGIFTIALNSLEDAGSLELIVSDVNGKEVDVRTLSIEKGQNFIPYQLALPSGVYLVKLVGIDHLKIQKMIIK